MKRLMTLFLSLALTMGLGLATAANAADSRYETTEPVDFTLPRLEGGELALSALRGGWVVVNYWATWCAPCRKEIPDLSALHSAREDITVLGLAYEDTDPAEFTAFLEDFDVTYPMLRVDVYDPPEPFGAPKVLPTTIILDPEGRAVKAFLGPVTREDLEGWIDEATGA